MDSNIYRYLQICVYAQVSIYAYISLSSQPGQPRNDNPAQTSSFSAQILFPECYLIKGEITNSGTGIVTDTVPEVRKC